MRQGRPSRREMRDAADASDGEGTDGWADGVDTRLLGRRRLSGNATVV